MCSPQSHWNSCKDKRSELLHQTSAQYLWTGLVIHCTVLDRYDQDSNGVMDRQEFKAFMEQLFGRRVTANEVEMMFREINVDEELTIDAAEFQGFCFGSGRFGEAGRYMKDVLSPPLTVEEEQTNAARAKPE